ncbi:FAD-dependent oxidoreductase [Roseibium aggregatum]|uniref:FAD-dependent oxidoreductase n=1 Tax=Roseibium aggregatum TaxID=187304 RepID=A0A926P2G3_9HYPH|nr:FAD-dependent oxidoreductase [Roseibium aggregatum]MBD1548821.1 FAD-dependent oxidoreductase [Roseibium aggregatum]
MSPEKQFQSIMETDLVVLGSGAGGLTAALSASLAGLDVLVLEHQTVIGGTSARSSGTVWVPDNHLMRAEGIEGDRERAETYLSGLVGERGDRRMWQAFLDAAPKMLADLEARADLCFRPYMAAPDYRQDVAGAASGGRPLEPLAFDGRELGEDFERLAWPLPELMLFGGLMVTRAEAFKLLRADRDPAAMWLGLRLVARFLAEKLTYKRGTRLVLGNALVARLLKALQERQVRVLTEAETTRLISENGRIAGVEMVRNGRLARIVARRGVVLAGGGFPASAEKRAENLPEPVAQYTPAAPGCIGRTLDLGLAAGAVLGPKGLDNAQWFPSSIMKRPDGSTAVYPHIVLDRSKPGLIAVDGSGNRFTNEAVSYHEFVRAMYARGGNGAAVPAWLVVDRAFIRKYGLGLIRPRTPDLRKYVASGHLKTGATIAELAREIGVPADALEATVSRYNGYAKNGRDPEFFKGETIYDRSNGDGEVKPNPCIGSIAKAPFYAVAVWPTPLGTSRGLVANENAQALDGDGTPIPGLYVCGNDMQSAFGGEYPGAGAQLGQAMTFGWIAARHAAAVDTAISISRENA